jgi:HEAT repeat protein
MDDINYEIREITAYAIGKIKYKEGIDKLIEKLNDNEWVVRKNVVEAIERIGDKKALTYLYEIEKKEKVNDVVVKIREAIKTLENI